MKGYSEASAWYASRVLPCLFRSLIKRGVKDLRAVTEADVVSFALELKTMPSRRGTSLSSSSQSHWLTVIRNFFHFLVNNRLVLSNPARDLSLPRRQRLPRAILSEAQAERLMSTPSEKTLLGRRDRAILETFYGTGIRLGELLRLDLADVNLSDGRLLIRDGKGRKDRVVPLTGQAAKALACYLKEVRPELGRDPLEPAVFLSLRGARMSGKRVNVLVKNHARAADILLNVTPHTMRHTCATHLLKGGADVRQVQELLGHRQLRTTALYTRVEVSDLRKVLERCHPREKGRGKAD
ncbi:MAG: tyrosine-type recombinase/integrase [Anaerolineales bacterium]